MLPKGTTMGAYELVRPLRDGQAGRAFLAVRKGPDGFKKPVVLYCTDRERLEAIAGEATPAARLAHAGIAHILDVGVHADIGYVATEHVPGTTLREAVMRHGHVPWRAVTEVVAEAALALAYAHGRRGEDDRLLGIVHGRVSPGRLTIEPGGSVRITGLGVSWAWPDHLGFGAPEEMRGEPIDGRADTFALGTVIRRCTDERTLPKSLVQVIDHATHDLPEHRSTAAQLHEALAAALRDARPTAAE